MGHGMGEVSRSRDREDLSEEDSNVRMGHSHVIGFEWNIVLGGSLGVERAWPGAGWSMSTIVNTVF